PRCRLELRHRLVGRLDLRENDDRALEIALAVLGRARVASGPVQELDAEALLEIGDVLADRRARQAQLAARFGKTAALDHLHEGPEAGDLIQAPAPAIVSKS